MTKAVTAAFLIVLASVLLGATVFNTSSASGSANDKPATPVVEQNLDATGNIKVHEQGTANVAVQGTPNVNVTNSSLPVHEQGTANVNVTNASLPVSITQPAPILDGGGSLLVDFDTTVQPGTTVASALSIRMTQGVSWVSLYTQGHSGGTADQFAGPADGGPSQIELDLARPITFDTIECFGGLTGDTCSVSWVGDKP